jgi:hypothetical protein
MPVTPPPVVSIPGQVNQTTQPKTTQSNFRQMVGEVLQWNPDLPIPMVKKWLNNAYRDVIDARNWYGLMVRGQVTTPTVYTQGSALFTLGSNQVVGALTAWTANMVGMQMRAGFSTGWQNIQAVDVINQIITLDLPWGNPTVNSGYQIVQTWVTLGYNIKMILEMVNQRQGWRLYTNWPQAVLNQYDTWRTTTGWSFAIVPREPTADGQPQFEIYPAPTYQQTFPFIAYTQPPDMVNDGDFPAPFVRTDALVCGALKDALLFRGKNTKYFDPQTSTVKYNEFKSKIEEMKMTDDNLYPKDMQWDYSKFPFSQQGAIWLQSHSGMPGDY